MISMLIETRITCGRCNLLFKPQSIKRVKIDMKATYRCRKCLIELLNKEDDIHNMDNTLLTNKDIYEFDFQKQNI